jgi:hypothetical protein
LDELEGGCTDEHRIWWGQPLNTSGQVGRFAQGEIFLTAAAADLAHDH